jgi:hypothetical protein
MSVRKTLIAVAIVAIVIIAAVVIYAYPSFNRKTIPATIPGTPLIAPKVIADTLGGTWSKNFYVSGGAMNTIGLVDSFAGVFNFTANTTAASNYTGFLTGSSDISFAGYSQNKTDAHLFSAIAFLPNVTVASHIYINFTAKLENNSSVAYSTGRIGSSPYVVANVTYRGNETQLIVANDGRYVILFVYSGKTGVSTSSFITLAGDEIQILGKGMTVSYPSQLVTADQMNTSIGSGFNSEVYAVANITGIGSLIGILEGNLTSSANSSSLNSAEMQYLQNITAAGIAIFGNPALKDMAFSSFITFNASSYPASIYQALDLEFSSNANYTHRSGTVSSEPYFYLSGNLSANSSVKITLLFCLDGKSLLVDGVMGTNIISLDGMVSLAAAQINDIAS